MSSSEAKAPQEGRGHRHHWMECVRVVQANYLVYYHNMRFFDGKFNWLSVSPMAGDDLGAVWQYQNTFHLIQRSILQVGLNMFFVLGGASNILSMREKQNLWRVMGERFTKLIVAFFFGFLLMGLPVSLTMLLYQEGTILDAPAKAWRKVLVASPGPLYFLPYMFALWVLHLPYFCVMKACYERNSASASSQSSEKTPPSSTGDHFQQPSLPPPFFSSQTNYNGKQPWRPLILLFSGTVLAPLLWMWCWLGLTYGTMLGLMLGILAFFLHQHFIRARMGVKSFQAFLHSFQIVFERFSAFASNLDHDWMLPMSTLAPSALLTWANQYFSSYLINTGIVLIYVLPFLISAFSLPTTFTFTFSSLTSCRLTSSTSSVPRSDAARFDDNPAINSRRKSTQDGQLALSINLPLLSLLSVVIGHILIISAPDILGPDEIPAPTTIFGGLLPLSKETSKSLGTAFFTTVSHSAFYVFGFAWMLFNDKLPSFWNSSSNLLLVFYFFANIFLLKWSFPDKDDFVFIGPGYITYRPRLKRFFYVWYWMWVYSQICKYNGNHPFQGRIQEFIRDSTFGLFLIHPVFEFIMGCAMNAGWWGMDTYTWIQKVIILNIFTFVMSYLTVYLLMQIPAVRPLLGVRRSRRSQKTNTAASDD